MDNNLSWNNPSTNSSSSSSNSVEKLDKIAEGVEELIKKIDQLTDNITEDFEKLGVKTTENEVEKSEEMVADKIEEPVMPEETKVIKEEVEEESPVVIPDLTDDNIIESGTLSKVEPINDEIAHHNNLLPNNDGVVSIDSLLQSFDKPEEPPVIEESTKSPGSIDTEVPQSERQVEAVSVNELPEIPEDNNEKVEDTLVKEPEELVSEVAEPTQEITPEPVVEPAVESVQPEPVAPVEPVQPVQTPTLVPEYGPQPMSVTVAETNDQIVDIAPQLTGANSVEQSVSPVPTEEPVTVPTQPVMTEATPVPAPVAVTPEVAPSPVATPTVEEPVATQAGEPNYEIQRINVKEATAVANAQRNNVVSMEDQQALANTFEQPVKVLTNAI